MPTEDRYEIQVLGLGFRGRHGVFEEERTEGREFEADVRCRVARLPAFGNDELGDTLDYRDVARIALEVGTGESVQLVEHLADTIAARCLALPPVEAVDVTVRKRATGVPGDPRWVAVRVCRQA
jgi:dihydroneopterin aldolase